jgi:ATP-dependent Clp protease ATP-binding subunit ClpX
MEKTISRFKFKLGCSFCGKSQDDVKKLICGPMAHICNECIAICQEILDSDPVKRSKDGKRTD